LIKCSLNKSFFGLGYPIDIKSLVDRFNHCVDEKNGTLIRFDMIQGLRNLFDVQKDEEIKRIALDLIESEEDPKYKKKYASLWRKV
jgi:hypothetical protein